MERDLDLSNLLDSGDPPGVSPEALQQVVSRQRRLRSRRHRALASSALVIALAGTGTGIGVGLGATGSPPGATTAAGSPPPGLRWAGGSTPVTAGPAPESPSRPASSTHAGGAPAVEAAPGEFGFVASPAQEHEAAQRSTVLPAAAYTDAGGSSGVQTNRFCGAPCVPVFSPGLAHVLFVRHLDGLTITAAQVSFFFPADFRSEPPGTETVPKNVSGSGTASSGTASSASTGSGDSKQAGPPPTVLSRLQPVRGICPSSTELEVTIWSRGGLETLLVPAGGVGTKPFSVLASAAADLPNGEAVVLAVARTSPDVAAVQATFASGRTDSMVPRDSWSVLAEVAPAGSDLAKAGAVRLVATSSAGATLETATLPASGSLATAPNLVCRYLVEPLRQPQPARSRGGSASAPPATVTPPVVGPVSTKSSGAG